MPDMPFVAVAMPCLNEEAHIEACLRSVLGQDYPPELMEIVVADGGSTDGTTALLRRLAAEDPRLHVVANPRRIQAAGLNAILRVCRGEVVVRMDAHCEYAPDYVRKCVEILARTGADVCGGAQRAQASSSFQRALCAALESPLGAGGASHRNADEEGFVDTVFLGAFQRRVFEGAGLYDGGAVTNEDAELNQRVLARGGSIYLSREIVVHYHPRDSYTRLAQQYFAYGRGRARTLLKHRRLPVVRPVLPFAMLAVAVVLCAASPLHPLLLPCLGAYALATGVEAVRAGRSRGVPCIARVWTVFPVMHVAHGLGFAAGLLRYALRPDWHEPGRLAPRDPAPRSRRSFPGQAA
jgi:succinoglycan biosynthesis protein ExoA